MPYYLETQVRPPKDNRNLLRSSAYTFYTWRGYLVALLCQFQLGWSRQPSALISWMIIQSSYIGFSIINLIIIFHLIYIFLWLFYDGCPTEQMGYFWAIRVVKYQISVAQNVLSHLMRLKLSLHPNTAHFIYIYFNISTTLIPLQIVPFQKSSIGLPFYSDHLYIVFLSQYLRQKKFKQYFPFNMQKMYTVEAIIGKKFDPKTKKPLYQVKWQGWDSDYNTWEPYHHLSDYCMSLLEQFQQKHKTLENTSINFQNSDRGDRGKKLQISSSRKRKLVKKMKRNSKVNKIKFNKQSDSQKENEYKSEQCSNNESMMDEKQGKEEIQQKQIQNKKKSEVFQNIFNNQKQASKIKQNQQKNQVTNLVKPFTGTVKYPIVLNLRKQSEMQHRSTQKNNNNKTENKYSKGFQRVKRNNEMQQKQQINIFDSKQQISFQSVFSQPRQIFTRRQSQVDQSRFKLVSRSPLLKEEKKEILGNFSQSINEKEKIQVLGLHSAKGVLSFYVQVQKEGEHSIRIWKSHEQMLSNYARQLCHFYQKNIEFQ